MKNSKLLIMALFISLTATAQVKIGGGPDGESEYSKAEHEMDISMDELVVELRKNDLKCSKTSRLKEDKSLVQIYLKLSLLENLEKSSDECAEANKYLACVHTRQSGKIATKILLSKHSAAYVGKVLSVEEAEAKKILRYFSDSKKKKK